MKLGLIGLGGYGQFLVEVIKEVSEIEICAVSSRNYDKAKDFGQSNKIEKVYANWKDLVKDKELDAVLISTPPYLHFEMAKLALLCGKNVLIEKPLATNLSDAKKLIDLAQKRKLRLIVDHELRYSPILKTLKKAYDQDLFGRLTNLTFTNFASDENLASDHWFWDKKKSGGIFIEHSCHFFDAYNYLFGPSKIKYSTRQTRPNGIEDKVFALSKYKNGAEASFWHSFDRPYLLEQTTTKISFERASFVIEGWIPLKFNAKAIITEMELKKLKEIFPLAYFKIPGDKDNYRGGGNRYDDFRFIEFNLDIGDKQKHYQELVCQLIIDFVKSTKDINFEHKKEAKNILPGLELACNSAKEAVLLR